MHPQQPAPSPLLTACALLLCSLAWVMPAAARTPAGDPPSREQAQRLLERERFDQAIEAYQLIADAEPQSALAWFDLAGAHHMAGRFEAAVEIGRRAAEFPDYRATSLYNVACASALLGRADEAAAALSDALAAGFLDYDLLAVDTDLEILRSAGRLPMPEAREYQMLRHGSVEVPYLVLLPSGYDSQQTYPAAVAFAPGGMGTASTDWTLDTLWSDPEARAGWIIVCAAQPSNGWINHPSHHALNALMTEVRKRHHVEDDRFHFIGLGEGGRPAATYSSMSRKYVSGLTLVDSLAFGRWDDDDVADFAQEDLPLTLIVTGEAGPLGDEAQRVRRLVKGGGGEVDVVVLENEGPALLALDTRQLLGRPSTETP
jgi:hypothetical protein